MRLARANKMLRVPDAFRFPLIDPLVRGPEFIGFQSPRDLGPIRPLPASTTVRSRRQGVEKSNRVRAVRQEAVFYLLMKKGGHVGAGQGHAGTGGVGIGCQQGGYPARTRT